MLDLTVCLDAGAAEPLYQQLYASLAEQIHSGRLKRGDRLPGKRSLAGQLNLAVNTVDTAYQMLVAEGYLEARERSGFFVQEVERPLAPPAPPEEPTAPVREEAWRFDLSTGAVDTALFPFRTWGRIQKELLYASPELLSHGHRQGDENLRACLADYLRAYRGVVCRPEQIVVGAGVEYLLGCLAHLFAGSTAAVENPGYSRTRAVLENNGWDKLEELAAEGNCVYKADTLEELAEMIGAENLTATVEAYNKDVAAGEDTAFGRSPESMVAFEEGPYYAVVTVPYVWSGTSGGVRANEDGYLQREDGSVITGLSLAGEILGPSNILGKINFGGINHSMCATWGIIAAENAAELAGK